MKNFFIFFAIILPSICLSFTSHELSDIVIKESLFQKTKNNINGPRITYRIARQYLFGVLHLKSNNGQYYIKDKYCHKIFTADIGVGPMLIPNHLLLNCEHTWPQSRFNRNFMIRLQMNDLHHLFPVDAKANSTRLNDIFAEISHGKVISSNCIVSTKGKAIGTNTTSFEPPNSHKGNIARALFYFSIRYKSPISQLEESYLRSWHELDPVDEDEIIRNKKILEIQKNSNPFIDDPSLVSRIYDF